MSYGSYLSKLILLAYSYLIVVSDDELEAPSVAVAVPGVHIKRTIMVDKVALNLPVVMTKRNNAKMVQVSHLSLLSKSVS